MLFTDWRAAAPGNSTDDSALDTAVLAGLYGAASPYKDVRSALQAILGLYDRSFPGQPRAPYAAVLPSDFPATPEERAGAWSIVTTVAMYLYYDSDMSYTRILPGYKTPSGVKAFYVRPEHARAIAYTQHLRNAATQTLHDDDNQLLEHTAVEVLREWIARPKRKRSLREERISSQNQNQDGIQLRERSHKLPKVASLAHMDASSECAY